MNATANPTRVIAIGMDSGDLDLIERWMADQHLPNVAKLFARGTIAATRNDDMPGYVAETPWTIFLTGCRATSTGYWSTVRYEPDYTVREVGAFDYQSVRPFYGYCPGRKVIAFDVPHARKVESVDGIQVLAWGAHSPLGPSESVPADLLPRLSREFGRHPTLNNDWMSIPDTPAKAAKLERDLITGVERRTEMCLDLLVNEPWNLLLVVFGETHSAGHAFWHLSQRDHPLYSAYADSGHDPLLAVFQAVDKAIGEIMAEAPADAQIVLFSPEGMKSNSSDVPSWVFLPELLFRHSFGGRAGLANGRAGAPLPPTGRYPSQDWLRQVWSLREDGNPLRRALRAKLKLRASWALERLLGSGDGLAHPLACEPFNYMPQMWYRPFWPKMKAFALPSFSDGYVRINLRGREAAGTVDPGEYRSVCGEISGLLQELVDPRTGSPVVERVTTMRDDPGEDGGRLPDADLVVQWAAQPTDVVDSPRYGRIGPVPMRRSGDHTSRGFFVAAGPGIPAGRQRDCALVDLAPTLLGLLGAPIPGHFEGRAQLRINSHSLLAS